VIDLTGTFINMNPEMRTNYVTAILIDLHVLTGKLQKKRLFFAPQFS